VGRKSSTVRAAGVGESGAERDAEGAPEATKVGALAPSSREVSASYTVVARRYRPQTFEDVVGQDHVVQALRNAIRLGRVTHAYLFAGTRGVGKTSLARIFAKCLNCQQGPTETPCNECDICRAISVGQDVDVIEIDGASNNGVEAVRELRQNVSLRPSRARYKIYYIDEVHMLSTGAFNALLKTLEEPPPHVKFLFATTEPGKIPVTVLSRCQRYDFAGIAPETIALALAEVCRGEGVEVEAEALALVARRASGSMRDALSLLEPLLSIGAGTIGVEDVRRSLGLASDEGLLDLLEALADRDLARAFAELDRSIAAGVQPGEVLAGVAELLRDAMVAGAGAPPALLEVGQSHRGRLQAIAGRWVLDTTLAALEIVSQARLRLRTSSQSRLIVELALARIARLENFIELGALLTQLERVVDAVPGPGGSGSTTTSAERAKHSAAGSAREEGRYARPDRSVAPAVASVPRRARETEGPATPPGEGGAHGEKPTVTDAGPLSEIPRTIEEFERAWPEIVCRLRSEDAGRLGFLRPAALEAPNQLVLRADPAYNYVIDVCDRTDVKSRLEAELLRVLGRPIRVRLERSESAPVASDAAKAAAQLDLVSSDPLVQKVVELFEARPVRIEPAATETPALDEPPKE
jgi:DNA polymerase-3 subunit gamma/tau